MSRVEVRSSLPPLDARLATRLRRLRNRHFFVIDLLALLVACTTAYLLRFEGLSGITADIAWGAVAFLGVSVPLRMLTFWAFGLYRRYWHLASIAELERVLSAALAGTLVAAVLGLVVLPSLGLVTGRVPLSILALDSAIVAAAITLPRFLARLFTWRAARARSGSGDARVLIVGAGQAGQLTARELRNQPQLGLYPIGFLDDDSAKHRLLVAELPVLGAVNDLPRVVREQRIQEVLIALPTAPGSVVRRVVQLADDAGICTKTLPGIFEILSGRVSVTSMREVRIEDLLRRTPIETDLDAVRDLTSARTVMITGAGGSIGSELCRQVASLSPGHLILLGHGENSIFEIREELRRDFPHLFLSAVIADIRDRGRMQATMARFAPDVVFHAAAHKHVPLMEFNVVEALTNNVIGTRNTVEAAAAAGVERFVLISTDKAVRPTSVMGASKRIAEQLVQLAASRHGRPYVAVRFGNVLGSRGSVIPTFLRQIHAGGPVTVTHPDMSRYFITIPEAVQLVLQACALGRGGEVFVLDMGEPVRIIDLARDVVRLSGLDQDEIEIRFSGVRPGEKLFEEMFFSGEQVSATDHPKVLRARNAELPACVESDLEHLIAATAMSASDADLRLLMQRLVPDYASGARDRALADTGHIDPTGTHVASPSPARPAGATTQPQASVPTS